MEVERIKVQAIAGTQGSLLGTAVTIKQNNVETKYAQRRLCDSSNGTLTEVKISQNLANARRASPVLRLV